MKKILTILIFLNTFSIITYSQGKINNLTKDIYLDSALMYFKQARSVKPVNLEKFEKGKEMLMLINPDYHAQKLLQAEAKSFNQRIYGILIQYYLSKPISLKLGFDSSYTYLQKIMADADNGTDELNKNLRNLLLALLPQKGKNTYATKIHNFLTDKLKHYLLMNDSGAVAICYWRLSDIYRNEGLGEKSIYLLRKSLDYINPNKKINPLLARIWPLDGMDFYINQLAVIGDAYSTLGDNRQSLFYLNKTFKLAEQRLVSPWDSSVYAYAAYHICLSKIQIGETSGIPELIDKSRIMSELTGEFGSQVVSWHIRGVYYFSINNYDSAIAAFKICMNLMEKHSVGNINGYGIAIPKYYIAQILMKQNRFPEAAVLLEEESLQIESDRLTLLTELKLLTKVYLKLKESSKAEATFNKINSVQDLIKNEELKNQSMSFESEKKITEAENSIALLANEKEKSKQTRNYLIGIAIIFLLLALGAYNRFITSKKQQRIIEKERNLSEKLLLNILPSTIADRLKSNEQPIADSLEDVSIVFIDIVDFTNFSEKRKPNEIITILNDIYIHYCPNVERAQGCRYK